MGGEEGQVEQVLQHRETPSLFGVENYRNSKALFEERAAAYNIPRVHRFSLPYVSFRGKISAAIREWHLVRTVHKCCLSTVCP